MILQMNGVSKSFGVNVILSNIKLQVKEYDRIAIVGRNGSGKSTLLKIMADKLAYDHGDIFKKKDLTIGYLPQHTTLESNKTIWNEMLQVFNHLIDQEQQLRLLEKKIQQASTNEDVTYKSLLMDYDTLQQSFDRNGGYRYESDIKSVLSGLDFHESYYDKNINELSGGQKTRLALGKLLLQQPELLILDEPTNHLDIQTLSWLEDYLTNYRGAIVIVSHDRYFLDKTVNIIYEISNHRSKKYFGSYSRYLQQKDKDYEKELKEYEQQQAEIKEMEDFIQRNIARASTSKRAQSRRKQLERIERLEKPIGSEASANFSFRVNKQSGNDVLTVNDLAFNYEQNDCLFSDINFRVSRGERIALVGPNGIGKTTLLKIIISKLNQTVGTIQFGTNVQIGYYDQEQTDLNSSKTVLKELWDEYPTVNEKDIRTVLGNFLFSGDDVLQLVHSLSGGEKARLALAKLMMERANLLILDEPTNHLDIDSKELLENALLDYPGTIIFVSHDRYFINKIADQVFEMHDNGITIYLGDYDYYVGKKQEEEERAKLLNEETKNTLPEKSNDGKLSFEQDKAIQREQRRVRRKIDHIENEISELEEKVETIEEKMTLPEVYQDYEKSLKYSTIVDELKYKIDQLMEQWTTLHE